MSSGVYKRVGESRSAMLRGLRNLNPPIGPDAASSRPIAQHAELLLEEVRNLDTSAFNDKDLVNIIGRSIAAAFMLGRSSVKQKMQERIVDVVETEFRKL